jgi:cytoskeleton protein RodZ
MAADRTPDDFGSTLRQARERRGLSLRQIASATKISTAALEALERNDISRLPGGIFSRAFVRSYAVEVGLDPEKTIQHFVAAFPIELMAAAQTAASRVEADNETIESDRRAASTFLRLIAVSIPTAIVLLYFATMGRHAPEPARTAPDIASPAVQPPQRVAVSPTPQAPATVTTAAPPADTTADHFMVGLMVKRPCWLSATVDGQKTIERLFQPGEQRTVEVRRELVLTAGDASAVALTLNGVDARPLGKTGEVVTARLDLTNFKDYLTAR